MSKRFIGGSYGFYDAYKENRWLWSEWEEVIEIMNNLDIKARERSRALSKLQKEYDKLSHDVTHWKINYGKEVNQNQILWNEINILMEQGVELSKAFQEYLDSISTEYENFWRRKLQQAKNDKVIE